MFFTELFKADQACLHICSLTGDADEKRLRVKVEKATNLICSPSTTYMSTGSHTNSYSVQTSYVQRLPASKSIGLDFVLVWVL